MKHAAAFYSIAGPYPVSRLFDVFNGDADGICALHQWRLANPVASVPLGLGEAHIAALAELGELLNYNGYGDSVADLHIAPADLYREIAPYADPFAFIAASATFGRLRAGFAADMQGATALTPCLDTPHSVAWLLPDAAWARRAIGVMANRLAVASADRAHALLAPNASGTLTVSVRAPKSRAEGADELCRRFATGGGRRAAAGINRLPVEEMGEFLEEFAGFFQG